jgi:hypothetical protein
MWSSSCLPHYLALDPAKGSAALTILREGIRLQTKVALSAIHIRGALVREFTGTTGEASVIYDLPSTVAGNNNWIRFVLSRGQWKVNDCSIIPIDNFGESGPITPVRP